MIIPAMDLLDGRVVRLRQGNYRDRIDYTNNPYDLMKRYCSEHVQTLHVVDLSGAQNPENNQFTLVSNLTQKIKGTIQVGGGIRRTRQIRALLSSGAVRVVVGSTAIRNPRKTHRWFQYFGPRRLVLALDVFCVDRNTQHVAVHGWKENTKVTLFDAVSYYRSYGLRHVLCTDISQDGTLSGGNVRLYRTLCRDWPNILFQASGGIDSLENIRQLKRTGVHDVIVGRALLENKFTLREATACWQKE